MPTLQNLRHTYSSSRNGQSSGLRRVFVKNNTFGFILLGYYHMRDSGKILKKYTTPSRVEITLTVDSVCKAMMEDD